MTNPQIDQSPPPHLTLIKTPSKIIPLSSGYFEDKPVRQVDSKELKEMVSVRITSDQGRAMDELLARLRYDGSSLKTRSDILRWSMDAGVEFLVEQFRSAGDQDPRSGWLRDHILQARHRRTLEDQAKAQVDIADRIIKVKEFVRSQSSIGNKTSAVHAIEQLATLVRDTNDPVWSQIIRATVTNDLELRQMCRDLGEHGYHTTLYRQEPSS